jgi:MFS family permease
MTAHTASRISTPRGSTRPYHGWLVVGAAFLVALYGWGIGFYGPGIYLVELRERLGLSTAEISFAVTQYYLLGATLILFAGTAFERCGVRPVVITGAVALAAGAMGLAFVSRRWQVHAAFAVMSIGWAAMSGAAINIIVAPWFERRRGLAVSFALNGASAGGIFVAPALILLIGHLAFAAALSIVVGTMLAVLVPVVILVLRPRRRGERDRADDAVPPMGASAGPPVPALHRASLLRDGVFQTIAVPFALGLTAQVGFLTHQAAYLSPILGTTETGWAIGLTTASAIAGRIATGFVVDRLDRRFVASANFLIQVAGMALLLSSTSAVMVYAGCLLFGLGLGNLTSLPGLIVQQEFPARHFARVVSLIVAINQFCFAFGPGLLGQLQRIGGYATALEACLMMQLAAAVIVMAPRLARMARPS